MNLRKTTLAALVLTALALTSCGTGRRAGKDLFIAVTSPAMWFYGGGTDGYTHAQEVRQGLGAGAATEVVVFPFTFVGHAIKHAFYGLVHAGDFILTPLYGLAELHPYGPEIEPLDIYTGTFFDESDEASGTDAESGETR